jgi:hypothetical protein
MTKFNSLMILLLLFYAGNVYSQTGTFDFDAGASRSGSSVIQTKGTPARTVTVSQPGSSGVDLYTPSGVTGISGQTATCFDQVTSFTISFSGSVNLSSLKVYESTSQSGSVSFAPTGGSNSAVNNQSVSADAATTVTLNWAGITSISVTATTLGYWGVDDIVMDATAPVELSSFTVQNNIDEVDLNWSTATEINNYGFDVERKLQNTDWMKIGFVQGHGNSNSSKSYSFVDKSPAGGKSQYRLKQIDHDGTFKYYNPVDVTVNISAFKLGQNYPNPFNPTTVISYSIPEKIFVKLTVFDVLGRVVSELVNSQQESGVYNVTLNGSKLNSGIYFYQFQAGNYSQVKKLLLLK